MNVYKAALGALKANYEAALSQETQLAAKLKESKQTVLGSQDRSFQYNLLTREVDTNRQLYDSLLQRYKEIGVAGGVGVNNITVVDKAKVPTFPFKPNLTLGLMIALARHIPQADRSTQPRQRINDQPKVEDGLRHAHTPRP